MALRPLTVFFGENSSGKSSLLQSILLLKQTTEAADRGIVFRYGGNGTAVDLGDFSSLANASGPLSIALDWESPEPVQVMDLPVVQGNSGPTRPQEPSVVASGRDLGLEVSVAAPGNDGPRREFVERFAYRVGQARFGSRRTGSEYRLSFGGGFPISCASRSAGLETSAIRSGATAFRRARDRDTRMRTSRGSWRMPSKSGWG